MTSKSGHAWRCLIISLPGRRGTARMRVWRALRAAGAAVLRDGVYLLPANASADSVFGTQAEAVRSAGGSAHILELDPAGPAQEREFRALFDRGTGYARFLEAALKLRMQLARRTTVSARRRVSVLRREFESLRATDYFPGPAADQALQALSDLEALAVTPQASGEPRSRSGTIARRDRSSHRGRTWATRARPWVDRLASAWLIRRFIDPRARILWLKDVSRCPRNALGFDFDGATFSHIGARVTFEHLLASFGLEQDAALVRFGHLVHCLDVGGVPVPEARGLAAVLAGARERLTDDNRLLAEASRIFDHLYHSYQKE